MNCTARQNCGMAKATKKAAAKAIKKGAKPKQTQSRPGKESKMKPQPVYDYPDQKGSDKLKNKKALITGGDSGIGRAVSVLFAKEGADIAIVYLNERSDAEQTREEVEKYGRKCVLIAGDLAKESFCAKAVKQAVKELGGLDILVNNAALHWVAKTLEELPTKQLIKTFYNNIFSYFWVTKFALAHLKKGSCIINTSSVTAYRGSPTLIDYAATKGAIVAFTRSLASNLAKKKIRVNGVAPGPIWTPLIASSFDGKRVATHGEDVPMERPGQPVEVAPAFLFLASADGSYLTGQFIHPNGGEIING